jgi:hypothetical protein
MDQAHFHVDVKGGVLTLRKKIPKKRASRLKRTSFDQDILSRGVPHIHHYRKKVRGFLQFILIGVLREKKNKGRPGAAGIRRAVSGERIL